MGKKTLELGINIGTSASYGVGYGLEGYGAGASYGYGVGVYGVGCGGGYGVDGYGVGAYYGVDAYGAGIGGAGYGVGYDVDAYGVGIGGAGGGAGYGYSDIRIRYWQAIKESLQSNWILAEPNAEIKRELIEAMGIDSFFSQLDAQIIHSDIDGCGNPRALVRFKIPEADAGYLQAIRVVCPTTGRIYHLGVSAYIETCQEAVASTFGVKPEEYYPRRES